MPDEMRRLKLVEDENGKLKQLVADLSRDKAMPQDVAPPKTVRPDPTLGSGAKPEQTLPIKEALQARSVLLPHSL